MLRSVEHETAEWAARTLGEQKRPGQLLVVFGAEHGDEGLARKRAMLETKNADLVVFNDVGRADIGFDVAENEVTLIARDGERPVAKASKAEIARLTRPWSKPGCASAAPTTRSAAA